VGRGGGGGGRFILLICGFAWESWTNEVSDLQVRDREEDEFG